METNERFDLIFEVGKAICSSYTGFSKSEIAYCLRKTNWFDFYEFLASRNLYEALIHFSLHPITDVVSYFLLFIGCMILFPDELSNIRLDNLLLIIDNESALDDALTNSRMMRALLAVNAKYVKSSPGKCFKLFYNCKRVLAHVFTKYPKYFDLNILKSNTKKRRLRFKKEEIEIFW